MRKLKKYKPTKFRAKGSYYDEESADFAVAFIERVICALNEAVCNEACDLNYIERILQNWQQKGLSTEDIENGKR